MFNKDSKFPNNEILRSLRSVWFEKFPNKKNSDLASELDINVTALSAYCSLKEMTPPRRCPDWIILKLIDKLDMNIVISKDSIIITDRKVSL